MSFWTDGNRIMYAGDYPQVTNILVAEASTQHFARCIAENLNGFHLDVVMSEEHGFTFEGS